MLSILSNAVKLSPPASRQGGGKKLKHLLYSFYKTSLVCVALMLLFANGDIPLSITLGAMLGSVLRELAGIVVGLLTL